VLRRWYSHDLSTDLSCNVDAARRYYGGVNWSFVYGFDGASVERRRDRARVFQWRRRQARRNQHDRLNQHDRRGKRGKREK
jgi:hypothetical protein